MNTMKLWWKRLDDWLNRPAKCVSVSVRREPTLFHRAPVELSSRTVVTLERDPNLYHKSPVGCNYYVVNPEPVVVEHYSRMEEYAALSEDEFPWPHLDEFEGLVDDEADDLFMHMDDEQEKVHFEWNIPYGCTLDMFGLYE